MDVISELQSTKLVTTLSMLIIHQKELLNIQDIKLLYTHTLTSKSVGLMEIKLLTKREKAQDQEHFITISILRQDNTSYL
jgi:hypothetical protein